MGESDRRCRWSLPANGCQSRIELLSHRLEQGLPVRMEGLTYTLFLSRGALIGLLRSTVELLDLGPLRVQTLAFFCQYLPLRFQMCQEFLTTHLGQTCFLLRPVDHRWRHSKLGGNGKCSAASGEAIDEPIPRL